jgi:hypothetical protein
LTSPSLRPEPPHPDPKDSIPVVQTRLWLATKEHLELVSQDQILGGNDSNQKGREAAGS